MQAMIPSPTIKKMNARMTDVLVLHPSPLSDPQTDRKAAMVLMASVVATAAFCIGTPLEGSERSMIHSYHLSSRQYNNNGPRPSLGTADNAVRASAITQKQNRTRKHARDTKNTEHFHVKCCSFIKHELYDS